MDNNITKWDLAIAEAKDHINSDPVKYYSYLRKAISNYEGIISAIKYNDADELQYRVFKFVLLNNKNLEGAFIAQVDIVANMCKRAFLANENTLLEMLEYSKLCMNASVDDDQSFIDVFEYGASHRGVYTGKVIIDFINELFCDENGLIYRGFDENSLNNMLNAYKPISLMNE